MSTLTYIKTSVKFPDTLLDIRLSLERRIDSLNKLQDYLNKSYKIPLFKEHSKPLSMDQDLLSQISNKDLVGLVSSVELVEDSIIIGLECDKEDVEQIEKSKLIFVGRYIDSDFLISYSGKKSFTNKLEFIITGVKIK